jgi:DNA-binding NtrC family response regulator
MAQAASRPQIRVLIAEDDPNQREGLAKMIHAWGFVVETASDGQEALEKLNGTSVDVLVTDVMMPRMDGFDLLRSLRAQGDLPPTIALTAFGNIETAVEMIYELGAFWFLEKPIEPSALKTLLERAAMQTRMAEEAERLKRRLVDQGVLMDLVGTSSAMQEVFSLIRQVAATTAALLVVGESGTGKELAARAVHRLSPRRDSPFVAINCAALPETLMESELFGHEKGAFTDAVERRTGCFELAHHGTLLLDELGEMPVATQSKLLRVLEDGCVRRLGGKSEIAIDVRVIASTNKVLEEALRNGQLREDLYYRLNVFQICLPALRQREGDLPALIETLMGALNRKHGTRVLDVGPEVVQRFKQYSWPGNIRELRNVLERAVIIAGKGTITSLHLPRDFGLPAGARGTQQGVEFDAVRLPVGTTINEAEKALILITLKHTGNNRTRAAEILGISLKTLFNKLKEYGNTEAEASTPT